jgi:uncharacterized protein (DUF302 family)
MGLYPAWFFQEIILLQIFKSAYSFAETIERLKMTLKERDISLFAIIDHSKAASQVSLELAEEVVLIFGDPKTGTFLMQENPEIGIELPLKVLVWKNAAQEVLIGYKDPIQFGELYHIQKQADTLKKMSAGLSQLISKVIHA